MIDKNLLKSHKGLNAIVDGIIDDKEFILDSYDD